MTNHRAGGHTQVLIPCESWKEAKKIIRRVAHDYSLTYSSEGTYAYRTSLPSLNLIFYKKGVLSISYDYVGHPVFFKDLEDRLEKENTINFPDDFAEIQINN